MKRMKNILSILLIIVATAVSFTIIVSSKNINQFKNPQIRELTQNLNQWVTITINNNTEVYNKDQAIIILEDFFKENNINEIIKTQPSAYNDNNTVEYYSQNNLNESFKIFANVIKLDNKILITSLTITVN